MTDVRPTDILHIHMHGGYYVDQQHKADFRFICDNDAEDVSPHFPYPIHLLTIVSSQPSQPTIAWYWNGTHTFDWRTKHACSQSMSAPDKDAPPPSPPKHSDDPPGDTEGDGDQTMLDPDFLYGRTRRSLMTILASSA